MFWRILPHLSACIADGRIIMLDVLHDRYFQIPEMHFYLMEKWLTATESMPPPDAILTLWKRNGILGEGGVMPLNVTRERVRVPTNPLSPIWRREGDCSNSLSVATTLMATYVSLRLHSLAAVLLEHRHVDMPTRQQPHDLLELSARFERGRRFSPIARRCLIDTLALDTWLSDAGQACKIVFGVTAAPFRAHCWLQAPVGVLNDSFDHVSRYTPILTV